MNGQLWIDGPLPGLNDMIAAAHRRRGKWDGYGALKREWGNTIYLLAKSARLEHVESPVTVSFVWKERDRRRDIDNVAAASKFVLDALVKAGVIDGDGQQHVKSIEHFFGVDKQKPGVLVWVKWAPF